MIGRVLAQHSLCPPTCPCWFHWFDDYSGGEEFCVCSGTDPSWWMKSIPVWSNATLRPPNVPKAECKFTVDKCKIDILPSRWFLYLVWPYSGSWFCLLGFALNWAEVVFCCPCCSVESNSFLDSWTFNCFLVCLYVASKGKGVGDQTREVLDVVLPSLEVCLFVCMCSIIFLKSNFAQTVVGLF